jgi:REP element-mobilizing transposase RayT
MPRSRYRFVNSRHPHFITATINHWLPVFTCPETMNIVLDSWKYLQENSAFEIFGYVILENHLHLVARSENIEHDIKRFKSYTAKEIVTYLKTERSSGFLWMLEFFKRVYKTESTYQVWEEGSHPQGVTSEEVLLQKLEYIHLNPVKRGYVDKPEHWRYSSARNYLGHEGLMTVCTSW